MPALINKDLKARLAKLDDIREELKKAEKSATKDVMELLKGLMKSNPLLVGLRWEQYTPHFNDGDACEFSVGEPALKFANSIVPAKDPNDEDDYEDGWVEDYCIDDEFFEKKADILNHKDIAALKKTVKDVHTVFAKLSSMEDALLTMFGDHMQITVTADGVESDDYEHD